MFFFHMVLPNQGGQGGGWSLSRGNGAFSFRYELLLVTSWPVPSKGVPFCNFHRDPIEGLRLLLGLHIKAF